MSFLGDVVGTIGGLVGGPAGAAVGKAVGGAVDSVTGGGRRRSGPSTSAEPRGQATGTVAPAGSLERTIQSAASGLGLGGSVDGRALASQIASGLPASVRSAVRDVARELQAGARNREQLTRSIQQSPEVKELVGAVRLAQLQTQATDEHRRIVADDTRHREARERQEAALRKLDQIIAKLERVTPVQNRFANLLGGSSVLNRLR